MRYANDDHTPLDREALLEAGIDPDSTQPRTGLVPCEQCRRPTLNLARRCDPHWAPPRVIAART